MPVRALLSAFLLIGSLSANPVSKQPQLTVADLPLVFSPDVHDAKGCVRFESRGPGYSLLFSASETVLVFSKDQRTDELHLKVANASRDVSPAGVEELPGKVNYLIGNDPGKWRTGVRTYRKLSYTGVLPGIDLVYYGQSRKLEYDFRVSPHADAHKIEMLVDGAGWSAQLTDRGDLKLSSSAGSIEFARPVAYQVAADGSRERVEAGYSLKDARHFGFKLGRYDRNRELVIDPSLVYSTYYGGSRYDSASKVAIDSQGNVYIVGSTSSNDLPGTSNGYQPVRQSSVGGYGTYQNYTAFVAKLNSTGSQLIYATYLGGSSSENGNGIAVDSNGDAIVVGWTNSTDFPLQNPVQSTCGPDAHIDNYYCTYTPFSNCAALGGGNGSVPDAFITKLDPTGSKLIYSTFFGGTQYDQANDVTVDASGEAYVTGSTNSVPDTHAGCPPQGPYCGNDPPDQFAIPTTSNAYMQPPVTGGCPSPSYTTAQTYTWFAKFSPTGGLDYSTYFGPPASSEPNGSGQTAGNKIALDAAGNIYMAGQTQDTAFASIPGAAVQCGTANCNNGNWNAWAAKFNVNNTGSAQLVYSTLFGGSQNDYGNGLAVDSQGNAYVTGNTNSSDFPVTAGALVTTYGEAQAAFVTKLNPQGNGMGYSTYLTGNGSSTVSGNGIAVDATGAAAVVGQVGGGGFTFPLVDPIEASQNGNPNTGYLVRMTPDGSGTLFSTYLGNWDTSVNAIVVDAALNATVVGDSSNFPTTAGAYSTTLAGDHDAFAAKVNMCTASLTDVTGQVTIARGGMRYVYASKAFFQTVTITNNSGAAIAAPIYLVIEGLSSNATLADATGKTTCVAAGSAYIEALTSGSLANGQTLTIQLQFTDPSMGGISYSAAVLSGAGAP